MPTGRLGGTMVNVELVQYPDVFLRSKSNEVKFPIDDRTQRLIPWMKKAMYQHNGIGLAAIQVGHQLRIFVMDCTRYADIEIQGPGVKKIIKIGTSVKKYD